MLSVSFKPLYFHWKKNLQCNAGQFPPAISLYHNRVIPFLKNSIVGWKYTAIGTNFFHRK